MSRSPLLVVTGTGTGIGKTHLTAALLGAWTRILLHGGMGEPRIAGLKPVESGVDGHASTDWETLGHASTFHVKHSPPYLLSRAVSPHLAAADEGRTIDLQLIRQYVEEVRSEADGVAVELPGGLFSPLAAGVTNADLARMLDPTAILLVAPDRLGVLHDVGAATRAAAAEGLRLAAVVLVAPELTDASTATNGRELAAVCGMRVAAEIPRAEIGALAMREDIATLLRSLGLCEGLGPSRL